MANQPLVDHCADWTSARNLVATHGIITEIRLPSDTDYNFLLTYEDGYEVTISIPDGEDDEGLGW